MIELEIFARAQEIFAERARFYTPAYGLIESLVVFPENDHFIILNFTVSDISAYFLTCIISIGSDKPQHCSSVESWLTMNAICVLQGD